MEYLSTFITGLHEPVGAILKETLSDLQIITELDGAILYETTDTIQNLKCMHNTFLVLDRRPCQKENAMSFLLTKSILLSKNNPLIIQHQNAKTFRLVFSVENNLVAVDKKLKKEMEHQIEIHTGLAVDREGADIEFWFLYRSEGLGFFMQRLTQHKSYDKLLHKGELHPELCYIMNWLSRPQKEDILLDPFTGYSAIAQSRIQNFPYQSIVLSDINPVCTDHAKEKITAPNVQIHTIDIAALPSLYSANTFDAIITDPPWGLYDQQDIDFQAFYNDILHICHQMLKKDGCLILLTARKEIVQQSIKTLQTLAITIEYHILVSGKKAALYKIQPTHGKESVTPCKKL